MTGIEPRPSGLKEQISSSQLAEMKVMRFPEDIKKKKVHGILKIIEPW